MSFFCCFRSFFGRTVHGGRVALATRCPLPCFCASDRRVASKTVSFQSGEQPAASCTIDLPSLQDTSSLLNSHALFQSSKAALVQMTGLIMLVFLLWIVLLGASLVLICIAAVLYRYWSKRKAPTTSRVLTDADYPRDDAADERDYSLGLPSVNRSGDVSDGSSDGITPESLRNRRKRSYSATQS